MTVKSSISNGIIYADVSGILDIHQCLQHVDFIFNLKGKIKNRYEFIDFTKTDKINLNTEDFEIIFAYASKIINSFEHSFVAIYANSDLAFGCSRMFQTSLEFSNHSSIVEIFREKEKAIGFLTTAMNKYG